MLKRILNNLLGGSNPGSSQSSGGAMKSLTIDNVREVLYSQMEQNPTTTTLDVKNELRRLGFQAFQDQVSQMVSTIASQDNLACRNNGKFNLYSFGSDTQEKRHLYLEGNGQFWEAFLEEKSLVIYQGTIGTDGVKEEYFFYKNLFALRELEKFWQEKINEGYREAIDSRAPLPIRQQFGHLLGKNPVSYQIGYYNVIKKEYSEGQLITKNAGYTFTWDLSEGRQAIEQVLNQTTWNSTQVRIDEAKLLGEKVVQRQPAMNIPITTLFEADNGQIFQVEIAFENGEKAVLSRFKLDLRGLYCL